MEIFLDHLFFELPAREEKKGEEKKKEKKKKKGKRKKLLRLIAYREAIQMPHESGKLGD